ncbi:DeoR/GlpR family DNA-binding transcription regulator [Lactiplantibacillus mudanjiangensis]|uniref:Lactose phosphotransferase system repressor n=1 Tax=Lactiplantibacillus mudanjiangensis TaxID=1296538 RepID=A0A660E507_9LACO|nr:DeoR/GlpR family DNA-binding transcription regulator [Lactiplantibacillus mudanjiangensis]VDG23978.1 transcriptional regulator [Lactobacillus rhamnosus GG] [Lactiplantibacillus mudanjiangensis]VDG27162.1 transcriptional regulator [Lactobacillus rhamnosus GG] [Lactiplantibacillus mudanjiangensis]
MQRAERQRQLLQELARRRQMSVADVMAALAISRDTARRDIVTVTERGLAQRIHGGLQVLNFGVAIPSYQDRLHQLTAVKTALAEKALPLIKANQYVFIDVSTTLLKLTQLLKVHCTVYTHSLDNAISLATNPAVTLQLLGGELNQSNRFMSGAAALTALKPVYFDQTIIGAAAVNVQGVFYQDAGDAAVKRQALSQTGSGILVCEHRKFGQTARFCGGQLAQLQVVITDEPLTTIERAWFATTTKFIYLTED